eukprot:scaffold242722_cov17-Prasinocladus_malaysianus.AAC.2
MSGFEAAEEIFANVDEGLAIPNEVGVPLLNHSHYCLRVPSVKHGYVINSVLADPLLPVGLIGSPFCGPCAGFLLVVGQLV